MTRVGRIAQEVVRGRGKMETSALLAAPLPTPLPTTIVNHWLQHWEWHPLSIPQSFLSVPNMPHSQASLWGDDWLSEQRWEGKREEAVRKLQRLSRRHHQPSQTTPQVRYRTGSLVQSGQEVRCLKSMPYFFQTLGQGFVPSDMRKRNTQTYG